MTLDGGVRTLDDSGIRERIARSTGETLFVNAGAGSGKTTALVERVASLVITDGVPMAAVAAVTFTEKAGAELRDRLREKFEQIRRAGGDAAALADTALNDLDQAAIGNEVIVQWGDHGRRIKDVRATVERFPYLQEGRNDRIDLATLAKQAVD